MSSAGVTRVLSPAMRPVVLLLSFLLCSLAAPLNAEEITTPDSVMVAPPAPATILIAEDHKYDNGEAIDLTWVPSIDDQIEHGRIVKYELFRSINDGPFTKIAELIPGSTQFSDRSVQMSASYSYYLSAVAGDGSAAMSVKTAAMSPEREWLNYRRGWLFLLALIVGGSVIYFIETARRGKALFVRKIAGLEAVDEAIGRATEMGRPILFIPGIQDMDDVQTVAGITILGRVARVIADYDTKVTMPVSRSLVMTAGRETIKAAYMAAGRPDAYSDDMVNYITDEQFGYVAAVDGIMVRQKPATCFYLGAFFAESLIMAETGNSIGAIQIAGTAMPTQLPFFVAACDFTLIGEELFAASAYLSGEPKQLGSLKGQDVGKAIALVIMIIGTICATVLAVTDSAALESVLTFLNSIFRTN